MCSMKRVQLAVLFVIAAALVAGTPALAAKRKPKPITHDVPLTCVADPADPDYGASGVAKFSDLEACFPTLQVTCKGLTPSAVYKVWCFTWDPGYGEQSGPMGSFTADKRGRGSVQGLMAWPILRTEVRRIDHTTPVPVYNVVLNGAW